MKGTGWIKKVNPLILILILPAVLDLILCMLGQSSGYWENYQLVNEVNPLAKHLLSVHPLLFVFSFIGYVFLIIIYLKKGKAPWNIILGIAFFLGHTWGSISWLDEVFNLPEGSFLGASWDYWVCILYILLLSLIAGIGVYKFYFKKIMKEKKIKNTNK